VQTLDTAAVFYLRALALLVEAHGSSVDAFWAELGVDPAVLADCDARIPKAIVARGWKRLAEMTGDAFLGVHGAEFAPSHIFHVVDHASANQPTLVEAARTMVRYNRLCDPAIDMRFTVNQEGAVITYTFDLNDCYSRHWAESLAAMIVCRARRLSEVEDVAPLRVRFQHPSPPSIDELLRVFRCPIEFDGPVSEVVFKHADMSLPVKGASEFLSRLIEQHATKQLESLQSERWTDAVGRIVVALLRSEVPRIETAARRLGCSVRTLQQRLKEEKSSFERVLDDVRRQLALQYLENPDIRILDVSLLLQYSDPSPFHRAFVRWTGMAPAQYREASVGRAS
jgi:AraC-like DNA-binding protein